MKEIPILMSAPMVHALLRKENQKTQTRRIVKDPEQYGCLTGDCPHMDKALCAADMAERSRYGKPGDKLWVRETGWERPERTAFMLREGADTWLRYYYDADGLDHDQFKAWGFKRRPSIFMPRWACRIELEVIKIRVERLLEISEADAISEGIPPFTVSPSNIPRLHYSQLWESINGAGSWAADPWVWVIEFRRIKP